MNEQFHGAALDYLARLKSAGSFDEILKLWRATSIPYSISTEDPHSRKYREEVLEIYSALTSSGYSAANELTSDKQSAEDFEVGYPWISRNLEIAAQELAKTAQALRALSVTPARARRILEFGCGWGNLAVPLARSGQAVTVVDIDEAFLRRVERQLEGTPFSIATVHGDFVEAAEKQAGEFDAIVFQSSFHHCLEFEKLLQVIRDRLLAAGGAIYFFSEPIQRDLPFPWGLRFDGESLWAIMCNKWLELGFREDFFFSLMLQNGFLFSRIPAVPGFVGEGWVAFRGEDGVQFAELTLPEPFDSGFWARHPDASDGRFLRNDAVLPSLTGSQRYECTFKNFGPRALRLTLTGDNGRSDHRIAPGESLTIAAPIANLHPLRLAGETFVPNKLLKNGDTREISVSLTRLGILRD